MTCVLRGERCARVGIYEELALGNAVREHRCLHSEVGLLGREVAIVLGEDLQGLAVLGDHLTTDLDLPGSLAAGDMCIQARRPR